MVLRRCEAVRRGAAPVNNTLIFNFDNNVPGCEELLFISSPVSA